MCRGLCQRRCDYPTARLQNGNFVNPTESMRRWEESLFNWSGVSSAGLQRSWSISSSCHYSQKASAYNPPLGSTKKTHIQICVCSQSVIKGVFVSRGVTCAAREIFRRAKLLRNLCKLNDSTADKLFSTTDSVNRPDKVGIKMESVRD